MNNIEDFKDKLYVNNCREIMAKAVFNYRDKKSSFSMPDIRDKFIIKRIVANSNTSSTSLDLSINQYTDENLNNICNEFTYELQVYFNGKYYVEYEGVIYTYRIPDGNTRYFFLDENDNELNLNYHYAYGDSKLYYNMKIGNVVTSDNQNESLVGLYDFKKKKLGFFNGKDKSFRLNRDKLHSKTKFNLGFFYNDEYLKEADATYYDCGVSTLIESDENCIPRVKYNGQYYVPSRHKDWYINPITSSGSVGTVKLRYFQNYYDEPEVHYNDNYYLFLRDVRSNYLFSFGSDKVYIGDEGEYDVIYTSDTSCNVTIFGIKFYYSHIVDDFVVSKDSIVSDEFASYTSPKYVLREIEYPSFDFKSQRNFQSKKTNHIQIVFDEQNNDYPVDFDIITYRNAEYNNEVIKKDKVYSFVNNNNANLVFYFDEEVVSYFTFVVKKWSKPLSSVKIKYIGNDIVYQCSSVDNLISFDANSSICYSGDRDLTFGLKTSTSTVTIKKIANNTSSHIGDGITLFNIQEFLKTRFGAEVALYVKDSRYRRWKQVNFSYTHELSSKSNEKEFQLVLYDIPNKLQSMSSLERVYVAEAGDNVEFYVVYKGIKFIWDIDNFYKENEETDITIEQYLTEDIGYAVNVRIHDWSSAQRILYYSYTDINENYIENKLFIYSPANLGIAYSWIDEYLKQNGVILKNIPINFSNYSIPVLALEEYNYVWDELDELSEVTLSFFVSNTKKFLLCDYTYDKDIDLTDLEIMEDL